jgi:hypothetical protein
MLSITGSTGLGELLNALTEALSWSGQAAREKSGAYARERPKQSHKVLFFRWTRSRKKLKTRLYRNQGMSRQGRKERKGFKGKTEIQKHPISLQPLRRLPQPEAVGCVRKSIPDNVTISRRSRRWKRARFLKKW